MREGRERGEEKGEGVRRGEEVRKERGKREE